VEEIPPRTFPLSAFAEVFDADHVPDSAVVRSARPGDGIAIVGGTKPLSDVFGEARVAAVERPRWPVVAAAGDVIWVPGVRRANAGWVEEATTRYLWVRAELEGSS
jgi:tRNA(Ile)-lysidine synthase